jgi:peroxiredoxin/tetratricopeptide (TPR) repeat protein
MKAARKWNATMSHAKISRISAAFVIVIALAAAWPLTAAASAPSAGANPRFVDSSPVSAPQVGSLAPDFSLPTADGGSIKLSDLRGKVVVVNFFATWCPPCRAETPDLVAAANTFGPRGVVFVGVDAKENAQLVNQFAAAKGVTFTLALDLDGKVNQRYDVRAIPTTYVVDRTGHIAYRQLDQLEGTVLVGALNDVIAGRVPNQSPLDRRFASIAQTATQQIEALNASALAAKGKGDTNTMFADSGRAIAIGVAANKQLDALSSGDGSSSINYFTSTQQRDALGAQLATAYSTHVAAKPRASTAKSDAEQADLLMGQRAEDQERFADALALYKEAASYAPKDTKPLDGIYLAAFEMKDYATAVSAAQKETEVAPADPESWLTLASANNSAKNFDQALSAEGTALALASVDYALHPAKKHAAYEVGRVFLKMGRSEILAGDNESAQTYLATSTALAPGTIVAQQAQEQLVALSPQPVYVAVSGATQVATQGSQPANLWVNVHNAAPETRMVHLAAVNVPKKWVLSFCYAKVCDPYKSDVSLGPNATRRVELRVVPLSSVPGSWNMKLAPSGVDQMNVDVDSKTAKASITVLAS